VTFAELIGPLEAQLRIIERRGSLGAHVEHITDDSRQVRSGSVFVSLKGERVDGHDFIVKAVEAGASALVLQKDCSSVEEALEQAGCRVPLPAMVQVKDSRKALGLLASQFHNDPSSRLRMIGVTGTNGKTTVTYLCKAMLEKAGRRVGLIGTVAYEIGAERVTASQTTPGAVEFQSLLARMEDSGLDTVVMEVSSHALALDRTIGCEFDVAIYTNLTQDHLDFHADLEDYFQAKLKLFSNMSSVAGNDRPRRAIVNIDDPRSDRVRNACSVPVWTYSIRNPSDVRAEHVRLSMDGTQFVAVTPAGRFDIDSRLVGEHNVYNILAAIAVGLNEGLSAAIVQKGIQSVLNIPGRFERVEAGQDFAVVVDYAHTEDALHRLLSAAQALKTGRIITVFGCGGDRDRSKRPKMGQAAARKSDVVFLTSDNPRTEDPLAILREVEVGVSEVVQQQGTTDLRYHVIPDRRLAIEAAVREAKRGDMVVIAGKGHEDYQIIGTERRHFDDREVARAAIETVTR
jgi:UDP-N-acetylmuramoyl-L-alanyl-D-glutamate--2,6-diaminopimelate ligase